MLVNAISLKPFLQSASSLKFVLHIIRRFDFAPSVKNKIAAIELLEMFAVDNPCESGIFRTISPIHFKLEICLYYLEDGCYRHWAIC